MGGAVAIETAARSLALTGANTINFKGVATIASMKEVTETSPKAILDSGIELLLMHNRNHTCKGLNSKVIGRLAGGIQPMLFDGEDHGVISAYDTLMAWLPNVMPETPCDPTREPSRGQDVLNIRQQRGWRRTTAAASMKSARSGMS